MFQGCITVYLSRCFQCFSLLLSSEATLISYHCVVCLSTTFLFSLKLLCCVVFTSPVFLTAKSNIAHSPCLCNPFFDKFFIFFAQNMRFHQKIPEIRHFRDFEIYTTFIQFMKGIYCNGIFTCCEPFLMRSSRLCTCMSSGTSRTNTTSWDVPASMVPL